MMKISGPEQVCRVLEAVSLPGPRLVIDCFNCSAQMDLIREYAKGHYAFRCSVCGSWRYYP